MMATGLGILWIVAGAVLYVLGWAGGTGRLKRNHWAGLRLPSIMASDEAWYAAHRVAAPWLQGGGGLTVMMGVLLLLFQPGQSTADAIAIVLVVIVLGAVIGAAVVGSREAKRVTEA